MSDEARTKRTVKHLLEGGDVELDHFAEDCCWFDIEGSETVCHREDAPSLTEKEAVARLHTLLSLDETEVSLS